MLREPSAGSVDKFTKHFIIWGAISCYDWIPKDIYRLLSQQIIPSIEEVYPGCNSIHRTEYMIDFIDKNISDRFRLADQTSKLNDVWSIDNVRSIVRTKLVEKENQNLSRVKTETVSIWKSFDTDLCSGMMLSVLNRL